MFAGYDDGSLGETMSERCRESIPLWFQINEILTEHHKLVRQEVHEVLANYFASAPQGSANFASGGLAQEPRLGQPQEVCELADCILLPNVLPPKVSANSPVLQKPPSVPELPYHSMSDMEELVQPPRQKTYWWSRILDLLESIQEPPRDNFLAWFERSKRFELVTMAVILFDMLYTIYATNWQMGRLASSITMEMQLMEDTFTVFYTVELLIKLCVHRFYFFFNSEKYWNIFDSVLVALALLDSVMVYVDSRSTLLNPSFVRIFRTIRILRKLSRVTRLVAVIPELRLMVKCILGSFVSLLLSTLFIAGFTMIFAIMFVQQFASLLVDDDNGLSAEQASEIQAKFGSVQQGTVSLFMCISGGADWGECYEKISKTGFLSSVLFMVYIDVVWLSLANIISGLFLEKALSLAQPDATECMAQHCRDELTRAKVLQDVFEMIDVDSCGSLQPDQVRESIQDITISALLKLQGIHITDVDAFCELLAASTEDRQISKKTFVNGCMRLQGHSSSADMFCLKQETAQAEYRLKAHMSECFEEFKLLFVNSAKQRQRHQSILAPLPKSI